MYRTPTAAALALSLLLTAGCSTEDEPVEGVVDAEPVEAPEESEVPEVDGVDQPLEWGETATVIGEQGTPMELTPTAVRYVDAEEIVEEFDRPDFGMFVAVQVEAAAVEGAEAPAVGAVPGGWSWRREGQQTSPIDGATYIAPWVGTTQEFTMDTVLLPGEAPAVGVVDFDIAGEGGHLAYTDLDGTMVRWEAPEESEGEISAVEDAL